MTATAAAVLDQQHALREGDLVFRRGRDAMSGLVMSRHDGSRFSHVGLVLDGVPVGRQVIHAVPDEPGIPGGVRIETLAAFLDSTVASDAAVYRIAALDAPARQRLRVFLQAQAGKPFDYDFALSTPDRLYCSELVVSALQHAGLSLTPAMTALPLMDEPVILPDALRQLPGLEPMTGEQDSP